MLDNSDDLKEFCNIFNASIEETAKLAVAHKRGQHTVNIGHGHPVQVGTIGPAILQPTMQAEPIVAIYLPESDAYRLIEQTMNDQRDKKLTFSDPRVYEEWLRYRMILELVR